MKKKKDTKKQKKAHPWLILWALLTAAAAGFMIFSACDMLRQKEGYAAPVLTACISALFFLISVMVGRKCPQIRNWPEAMTLTLIAEAAAELILLPVLGKMLRPSEVIIFILTAAAAGLMFLRKRTRGLEECLRIPLILGILAAGIGILMMNTIAYMIFSGGDTSRLWIAVFFAGMFILFAVFLGESALGERNGKALCVSLAAAFLAQTAALIYGWAKTAGGSLLTFQEISAGVLFAAVILAFISARKGNKG